MVAALDDSVGEIKEALKQKKMLDNCVIVFTTDNGGPANGYDDNAASNFPLRYIFFLIIYVHKTQLQISCVMCECVLGYMRTTSVMISLHTRSA